jgi:anti-sigma factor RsiW
MRADRDPVTEADLLAYVDGELDFARRVEVERHLAGDPERAAQVMADLHTRGELRLALSELPMPGEAQTTSMAHRVQRRLRRRVATRRLAQAAAAVLVLGAGWVAQGQLNLFGASPSIASTPPPAFVADALEADRTFSLRNGMASQTEVKRYDREGLRAATAIALPLLPGEWTIDDVQVFPSTFGPSIAVAIETRDLGRVTLFAARPGDDRILPISTVLEGGVGAAFWQEGEVAYALAGGGLDRARLVHEASRIEQSLP